MAVTPNVSQWLYYHLLMVGNCLLSVFAGFRKQTLVQRTIFEAV